MDFHTPVIPPAKRTFDTGATRDTESGKLDYEGFLSPLVLKRYAEYLNGHRTMSDGSTRASDNWQKGIPLDVYIKSEHRHHWEMWMIHRGWVADIGDRMEDAMCGLLFNVMGYLHERLKKKKKWKDEDALGEHQPHDMELAASRQNEHDAKSYHISDLTVENERLKRL